MCYRNNYAIIVTILLATILAPSLVIGQTDAELAHKAIRLIKDGELDKAIEVVGKINAPETKLKTMGEIGDQDASRFWSVWGVALITNFDAGGRKPIKSASIINGIVRVEEENEIKYGLGLEVHRFIWGTSWGATTRKPWSGAVALGPYVSVLPGTNNIIDTIGTGIVLGFLGGRSSESEGNKFSMNIAVGYYVDPETRVLADGFEDGKAPPPGETTVRYSSVAQYGFQGVLSFSYKF